MNLKELPNIGPELATRLESAGFNNAEALKSAGSKQAFLALHAIDSTTCISTFYALERAIRGIRWHQLPVEDKRSLLDYYNLVKSCESVSLK